jgi:uncharacterized pyridoxamine 5'-phosphate oxidase family protein
MNLRIQILTLENEELRKHKLALIEMLKEIYQADTNSKLKESIFPDELKERIIKAVNTK